MTRFATTLPLAAARLRMVVAAAVLLALLGTLFNLPQRVAQAAARPDVVVFYLDDLAAYPMRLWADPSLTPNLARFAKQGMRFERAVASTPLCGPARANLLTGQYGHNSGVTQNHVGPFDQRGTLSPKLRARGYKTVFIGKFINRLERVYPTRAKMWNLARDWSRFEIMWEEPGAYYDWRQYRKNGTWHYGSAPTDHSSYQAARRAAHHIAATPASKRLFMTVSLYDAHAPITPMARFKGHPACAEVGGWAGPAYNEEDVSDKPRYVRAHPLRSQPSYDLRERCEALLTIDWVVGEVQRALSAAGRSWNTLQIVTADNGWLMGGHRLVGKGVPYSARVPLFMRWPKVMGNQLRIVREPVSNVDLAPTICALAGCAMPKADGINIVPLIKHTRSWMGRDFVWTELLHNGIHWTKSPKARPGWAGLETTRRYSKTPWAYAKYRTGEEELYDLATDPHRLRNLAGKPAYANRLKDMRRMWRQVWNGDRVRWQPRQTQ